MAAWSGLIRTEPFTLPIRRLQGRNHTHTPRETLARASSIHTIWRSAVTTIIGYGATRFGQLMLKAVAKTYHTHTPSKAALISPLPGRGAHSEPYRVRSDCAQESLCSRGPAGIRIDDSSDL